MKLKITFLSLIVSAVALAQAPTNYYNTATGTGFALKTQLHNIIDSHNDRGYGGLYTTYTTSDKDFFYENNGTMLDMYSENPNGADAYEYTYGSAQQDDGTLGTAEGQRFNREHLIPQSYFAGATPMYSDAHFVVPADKYVNGQRDNIPFGVVATATLTTTNGSKKGTNLNSGYSAGYTSTVFEPINEFKGDIARMVLYFATRYEGQLNGFYIATNVSSTQSKAMFDGTENKAFSQTFLNILLTWHEQDPVSPREVARNNAIYARQNNRNPFIDRPQYVAMIWGTPASTQSFDISSKVSVYPNPATSNIINILSEIEITSLRLISINGQVVAEHNNPVMDNGAITLNNLPQGFYILTITSPEGTAAKKIVVN